MVPILVLASAPVLPGFSFVVLLTLLAVVGVSSFVFWVLAWRATTRKRWLDLSYWAASNKLRLYRPERARVPTPLDSFGNPPPDPLLLLANKRTSVAQLQAQAPRAVAGGAARWNVLVRQIATDWPPVGLRPAHHASSLLDLISLSSYPALLPPERFVAFGSDPAAIRHLARSTIVALLPPDVGFVLYGPALILDFSDRPFDTIELSRMVALADQLEARLPPPV